MDEYIDSVTLVAPPFWYKDHWGTIPPAGYGGIEWSMVNLMDGLLALDVPMTLLGAPDSQWPDPRVEVAAVADPGDITAWLAERRPTMIHDFANFSTFHEAVPPGSGYCRTWAMTSPPPGAASTVYVSEAQRLSMPDPKGVSIPLSVNPARYVYSPEKDDYYLFLGRVSSWKGTYQAAALAARLGGRLIVAGPCKDAAFQAKISDDFPGTTTFVGEVGGTRRLELLARARAIMVLSQPVLGPWGQIWCEPGATVVSEAAACGTPVIATRNGCLPSLVPGIGALVATGCDFSADDLAAARTLPPPATIRELAIRRWGHVRLAEAYLRVYRERVRAARGAHPVPAMGAAGHA